LCLGNEQPYDATTGGKDAIDMRIALFDELISFIKQYDEAPQVFGFNIKPTAFIALKGYLATAVTAFTVKLLQHRFELLRDAK
jgi:hypothetical protein